MKPCQLSCTYLTLSGEEFTPMQLLAACQLSSTEEHPATSSSFSLSLSHTHTQRRATPRGQGHGRQPPPCAGWQLPGRCCSCE